MKTLEVCLGHIKGTCPNCKTDEKNKECPDYTPTTMRTFKVKEYTQNSK